MKTWTIPVATAQQFVANDYVAACFKMSCEAWSPFMEQIGMEEGAGCFIENLYADTNGNGLWDGKNVHTNLLPCFRSPVPFCFQFFQCKVGPNIRHIRQNDA